jgi:hypothetical protein
MVISERFEPSEKSVILGELFNISYEDGLEQFVCNELQVFANKDDALTGMSLILCNNFTDEEKHGAMLFNIEDEKSFEYVTSLLEHNDDKIYAMLEYATHVLVTIGNNGRVVNTDFGMIRIKEEHVLKRKEQ